MTIGASLPLVMFDTNVLFDFFLGRDPDIQLLVQTAGHQIDIRVPELILLEFRGSILRELGQKQKAIDTARQLAKELDRADQWMSGVESMRRGYEMASTDIERLRSRVDPFLDIVRRDFNIEPHTSEIHYLGDLRYLQGLPPDEPRRGVQDCRIFEAVLAIARTDSETQRPARFFLTKDSDFLKKLGVKEELAKVGVELIGTVGPIYWQFHKNR